MIYEYQCESCGRTAAVVTTIDGRDMERQCRMVPELGVDPHCTGRLFRVMSRPHFTMGANASRHDDARARQQAWKQTPEVQAKLRSGEYQEAKAQR